MTAECGQWQKPWPDVPAPAIFVPLTGLSLVCWGPDLNTCCRCGLSSAKKREDFPCCKCWQHSQCSPGPAGLLCCLATVLARVQPGTTLTPSSFSAKLLSAPACAELIAPLEQEFALSFITFIEFQATPGPFFHPVEALLKGGQSCQHIHVSAQ